MADEPITPPVGKQAATERQKKFYANVSPATIAEVLNARPKGSRRLWLGMTGSGKEPNYQYEINGRIIRGSLKHEGKLEAGTFNESKIVEIDVVTGKLLPYQDLPKQDKP